MRIHILQQINENRELTITTLRQQTRRACTANYWELRAHVCVSHAQSLSPSQLPSQLPSQSPSRSQSHLLLGNLLGACCLSLLFLLLLLLRTNCYLTICICMCVSVCVCTCVCTLWLALLCPLILGGFIGRRRHSYLPALPLTPPPPPLSANLCGAHKKIIESKLKPIGVWVGLSGPARASCTMYANLWQRNRTYTHIYSRYVSICVRMSVHK